MWEQLYSFHTLRSSLPDFVERATNDPTSNDIYYAVPHATLPVWQESDWDWQTRWHTEGRASI